MELNNLTDEEKRVIIDKGTEAPLKDSAHTNIKQKKYWFRLGYDGSVPLSRKYQFPKTFYPVSIEGWFVKTLLPVFLAIFYIVFNNSSKVVLNVSMQGIVLINILFMVLVTCFLVYVYYKKVDRSLYDEVLSAYNSETQEQRRVRNKKTNRYAIFLFIFVVSLSVLPFLNTPLTSQKTAEKFIENIEDGKLYESYFLLSPDLKKQFGGKKEFTKWATELKALGLPENVELKDNIQKGVFSGVIRTKNLKDVYVEISVIKIKALDFKITSLLIK